MPELVVLGKRLRLPPARTIALWVSVALLSLAAGLIATACASVLQNPADVAEQPQELS